MYLHPLVYSQAEVIESCGLFIRGNLSFCEGFTQGSDIYIYIHITHTTHDAGIFIPICYIMLMFIMQVEANIFIYIYNPMDAMGRNGAFPTENL